MDLFEKIINKQDSVSVVGLGYVGLPLAVAFAKHIKVVGFDVNEKKISKYINGIDVTNEVGNEIIQNTSVVFTSDESKLKECMFHIIAVPTPVSSDKTPDLTPVINACKIVGRNLKRGAIVVFESTVYPGVTEEICIPILEEESQLRSGSDFKVGYSPERINPGDKKNRLETIVKVVSGMDKETLEVVAKVYEIIIRAGVHRAPSIKVAEASKVIENSQRDINIAFMNELSIIFNKMEIDTKAVLEASGTKWNFLNFTPGLVGGHCIGIDPYYFIYKAEQLGYHSQIILAGRRINDDMAKFVSENVVKKLIKARKQIIGSRVVIFGITFKENCPDARNTKVIDIINELKEYEIDVVVVDPVANKQEVFDEFGIELIELEEVKEVDAVIVAVPHNQFLTMKLESLEKLYTKTNEKTNEIMKVLIDIKGIFNKEEAISKGYLYWRL